MPHIISLPQILIFTPFPLSISKKSVAHGPLPILGVHSGVPLFWVPLVNTLQFLSASGALCFKRWSSFISSSRSAWSPWSSRSLQFRVIVNLFARKGSKAIKSCLACCSRFFYYPNFNIFIYLGHVVDISATEKPKDDQNESFRKRWPQEFDHGYCDLMGSPRYYTFEFPSTPYMQLCIW